MYSKKDSNIEYKGNNPAIQKALERVKPITLEEADWSDNQDFGIIGGFIAVLDGRTDLLRALQKARELIQIGQFENVAIIRQSSTLDKTADKIGELFHRAVFGKEPVISLDKEMRFPPVKQGTILIDPDHNNFFIKMPSDSYGMTNALRSFLNREIPVFAFPKAGLFSGNSGIDIKAIFGPVARVFPESMSVNVSKGKSTSEPGLMHFDSGYLIQEVNTHGPDQNRSYSHLPKKFLKAAYERYFEALPGGVTITASITGGGSITRKTNQRHYDEYKKQQRDGVLLENKVYFQDGVDTGFQTQDGDILIMRNDNWPDDEHGNPRLPSDHCSTFVNAYGHEGNQLGRTVCIMSSKVCYMAPQIRELLGMSRVPEPHEYIAPKQKKEKSPMEHAGDLQDLGM